MKNNKEDEKEERPKPAMVDWYSPSQLLDTGFKTLISTILGERLDSRLLVAAGEDGDSIFRDYADRDEVVFEYLADTGDGWDTTYTMAYLLSKGFSDSNSEDGESRRSDFVIMGGDEVYPVSSRDLYAFRLVWPFNVAARSLELIPENSKTPIDPKNLRDLYLIPGNHDWYDNLAAFTRRFLSERTMGAFQTRQRRSYFIIKLPGDWHIWGADIQLGKDIDWTQFAFFKEYAAGLSSKDKVILCSAEPLVVYGTKASEELIYTIKSLQGIATDRGARVPILIAGDVHNYQRYVGKTKADENGHQDDQVQIVSGGGGAFLHPTHSFESDPEGDTGFSLENRYPPEETSKKLGYGNLLFPIRHWGMALMIGGLLTAMFWSVPKAVNWLQFPIEHTASFLLMLLVIAGTWLFSGKRWSGFFHGLCQVAIGGICWKVSHCLVGSWIPDPSCSFQEFGVAYLPRALMFAGAAFFGAFLFGGYLIVSLNWLRNHHNEAFSALAHEDHKHYLRARVDKGGTLSVEVIAVPETAPEEGHHPVDTEVIDSFTVT